MSPEREREYTELHAYIDFYATNLLGIDPSKTSHPTNVGAKIIAEYGKSKALEGLKQAANDTIESLCGKPPEYIQQLDAALKDKGIITFTEVLRRYSSSYKRILKRGEIKTETEYYIIAGIVADSTLNVSDNERSLLDHLVTRYEEKIA
jgi:hypothetical protein